MSHTRTYLRCLPVLVSVLFLGATELAAGESRWYLETKLGEADFDGTLGTRAPKFFDSSHDSISVEVGYSLSRFFAVQAGYHDLGEFDGFGSPCSEDDEACPASFGPGGEQPLILCAPGPPQPPCVFPLVLTPMTADVTGLSLSAVPRLPLGERFSIYGKIGVIEWDADVAERFRGRPIESFSDRDLLTAVGLHYAFPIGLGILAEYQELDFDVRSTSVGASYRF